jgi:DNA-binding MarR family transcriptional regulator
VNEDVVSTRWLRAAELADWMPFCGVLLALPSALDSQLRRDSQLSLFGYLILAGLSDAPDHTRPMSELAVLANGSLSRLSHAVSGLEQRGLVRRSADPGNGRITVATLTYEGYETLKAAAPGHVEAVRRLVLDRLKDGDLHTIGRAADTILTGLAGPCPPLDANSTSQS